MRYATWNMSRVWAFCPRCTAHPARLRAARNRAAPILGWVKPDPAVVVASLAIGTLHCSIGVVMAAGKGARRGVIVFLPPPVLERLDGGPATADSIWVSTARSAHAAIGHVGAAVASRLAASGYLAGTQEICVIGGQDTASGPFILAMAGMLGLRVVTIMLMGLISALSAGVFERTCEIGILLGWLVYQGLPALVRHEAAISLPEESAPAVPLITLAGVLVLRLLVVRGPLRRASRIQPGPALWHRR